MDDYRSRDRSYPRSSKKALPFVLMMLLPQCPIPAPRTS